MSTSPDALRGADLPEMRQFAHVWLEKNPLFAGFAVDGEAVRDELRALLGVANGKE
jgi:hypothetical protein